ncbi:MAG: DUF2284 domain-containing protein [Eubacteriales bacterium]|nr:DUF2284 domain-containing protein [Eubacteriales bacterium]
MKIQGFDEFIADYPVFEYRIIDTQEMKTQRRVRQVCERECERYGSTWACPPGVGSLEDCEKKIKSYPYGILFSSVAEVSDIMNMEELLSTRRGHEEITNALGDFLKSQGKRTFILSTESCDICSKCTYPAAPCRHPDRMHPCLESYGVVVSELVEREQMEYQLGANTILWFSLILIS